MPKKNFMLKAALAYFDYGLSVIPVAKGTKEPLKGMGWKNRQKKRLTRQEVRTLFKRKPGCQIAIVLGPVSQWVIVRDFDSRESYEKWRNAHPEFRSLPVAQSGNGFHVYARAEAAQVKKLFGGRAYVKFPPDSKFTGEVRLQKCIIVAPPSIHPNGAKYKWIKPLPPTIDDLPVVDLEAIGWVPERFAERSVKPGKRITKNKNQGKVRKVGLLKWDEMPPDLRKRVKAAIELSLTTGKRQRNGKSFELARRLLAIPELAKLNSAALVEIVKRWHRKIRVHSTTPYHEVVAEFARGWAEAHTPFGKSPFTKKFMKRAARGPYPKVVVATDSPVISLLCGICRDLQHKTHQKSFFLSCRKAADALGIKFDKANKLLRLLEHWEVLECTRRGDKGNPNGKANRFRYKGPQRSRDPKAP